MSWALLMLACAVVAFTTWAATWAVLRALVRLEVYDTPNSRSSHVQPKPRGGGLALLPVLFVAWCGAVLWLDAAPPGFWLVLLGAGLLIVVSCLDDLRNLPAGLRLLVQTAAVALGLAGMDGSGLVFQGLLPPLVDHIAAAVLWLWFVNLFNFMDGIDGIAGVEAMSLALGLVLVGGLARWDAPMLAHPALLAAATLGFLVWNWAPAKLFLGDVGSVPLGYLLGWLLLLAAMEGQWAAALILPLYYLSDATVTIVKRGIRRAKIWQAHKEHFYQRAVQGGWSHARVATGVLICNVLLIGCAAMAALGYTWPALGIATLVVIIFLFLLERMARLAP
ncbi:MAG: glycosyltransferase family 4 protein [Proteobacteria bacterium]|nr:glycosyltransferase family 4 protein [Pseudomonadota bacterium]